MNPLADWTKAVRPGDDDRVGRWWWEVDAPKECGIHYKIETDMGGDAVVKSVRVRDSHTAKGG